MSPVNTPWAWSLKLLQLFLNKEYREEVEGDLEELFQDYLEDHTLKQARRMHALEVLKLFRLRLIRNLSKTQNQHLMLFKNDFKIAWRQMSKDRLLAGIKIGGFALSIAACLLISLYVNDELSYDQHYPEGEQIYRLAMHYDFEGQVGTQTHFQAPYAKTLKAELPEVVSAGRINGSSLFGAGSNEVSVVGSDRSYHEEKIAFFDQELLEIIQPRMIAGSLQKALAEPRTIVISEEKAQLYFPQGNALGQTLLFNQDTDHPYKIGGIMETFSDKSHMDYDLLLTLTGVEFGEGEQNNWSMTNYYTYLKVNPGTEATQLAIKIDTLMAKYWVPTVESEIDEAMVMEIQKHYLQPIGDVHLHSIGYNDGLIHGDIRRVWMFGCIAGFILLLACINFINLSTAKSANRAKEVGLRKTLGGVRAALMQQFLTESLLYSLLSVGLGILLASLLLPSMNELAGKELTLPWGSLWLLPGLLLVTVFIGLVAGFYPALYLSSFMPAQVLKGGLLKGVKNTRLRSALVVFQFTTSIVLIIGTITINEQMRFILNTPIGYDKDQVILLQGTHTLGDDLPVLKEELLKLAEVKSASVSDYLPISGKDTKRNGNTFFKDGNRENRGVPGQFWRVDDDYLRTMGMELIAGRDFADLPEDNEGKIILNETLARSLGYDQAIGKKVANWRDWEVIGVVKDFHFETMHEEIKGLSMVIGNSPTVMTIRTNTDQVQSLMAKIDRIWSELMPHQALRYEFLDDRFAANYADVSRTGNLFTIFAVLAICIACLGLFALSAYMVEQRSKEVSIRKVLGASIPQLLQLLTKSHLLLILLSMIIASPIAWYMMQWWLQDFAYRIEISWVYFVLAGLAVFVITLITVAQQAIKASVANPATQLRNE